MHHCRAISVTDAEETHHLVGRFHETNHIERSNSSDLILRRPRSWRGRLEGWPRARSHLWPSFERPSFETRASFDKLRSALLRTRLTVGIGMIRTWKRCSRQADLEPIQKLMRCSGVPTPIKNANSENDTTECSG